MEWIKIFLPYIVECIENLDTEQARQRVRNPGPRAVWRMYRDMRNRGLSRREATNEVDRICEDLQAASDAEIDQVIADAREMGSDDA